MERRAHNLNGANGVARRFASTDPTSVVFYPQGKYNLLHFHRACSTCLRSPLPPYYISASASSSSVFTERSDLHKFLLLTSLYVYIHFTELVSSTSNVCSPTLKSQSLPSYHNRSAFGIELNRRELNVGSRYDGYHEY